MLAHLQDPQENAAKAPEVTSLEGLLQDIRSRRKEFEALMQQCWSIYSFVPKMRRSSKPPKAS